MLAGSNSSTLPPKEQFMFPVSVLVYSTLPGLRVIYRWRASYLFFLTKIILLFACRCCGIPVGLGQDGLCMSVSLMCRNEGSALCRTKQSENHLLWIFDDGSPALFEHLWAASILTCDLNESGANLFFPAGQTAKKSVKWHFTVPVFNSFIGSRI